MWIPLQNEAWLNLDHVVRLDFAQKDGALMATVITTKPGGSDRTFFYGKDAETIRETVRATQVNVNV